MRVTRSIQRNITTTEKPNNEALIPSHLPDHHERACASPSPIATCPLTSVSLFDAQMHARAQQQKMPSMEQMQAEQMKQKEQEQMRSSIVSQVMQPEARERLSRIAIVKPEKARAIEDMVIQMAQRGQLTAKIDEDKLIDLLSRAGETEEKQRTKVTSQSAHEANANVLCVVVEQMKRRTYFSDEDDDDDDDF